MKNETDFSALFKKVEQLRKSGTYDLSNDEDLSLAVMNLVSLEEHFFFTGVKTNEAKYFDWLIKVRDARKALLAKLIDKHEGETWCISKHLLATTMRLMEVGTKLQAAGKKPEAKEIFEKANEMYALFWGLRLKLIEAKDIKTAATEEKPWTLKDIVNKLVDCCDE